MNRPNCSGARCSSFMLQSSLSVAKPNPGRSAMEFLQLADIEQFVHVVHIDIGIAAAEGRKDGGPLARIVDRDQALQTSCLHAVVYLRPILVILRPAEG